MNTADKMYVCPMHPVVRQPRAGKCPTCGMDLVAEGTRFALLKHIATPRHLAVMAAIMAAAMIAFMMMR